MISFVGIFIIIDVLYIFEDLGFNKEGNIYYYIYCINWEFRFNSSDLGVVEIVYMISNSLIGLFIYKGIILKNFGKYFGCYGNNYYLIVKFKNKWYIFYYF